MKIGGIDPKTLPNESVLVLPRVDPAIVFRAQGLANLDEFEALCPAPKPPVKVTRQGPQPDVENEDYQTVLREHQKRQLAYLIVRSLAPSEIEWDTVKLDQPATWANWEADLKAAGLNQVECNLVSRLVMEANSLDEAKLEQARAVFLRTPQTVAAK